MTSDAPSTPVLDRLLDHQRNEFTTSEHKLKRVGQFEFGILLVAIGTFFIDHPNGPYLAALISMGLTTARLAFRYSADKSRRLAERARRTVLLCNGLGLPLDGKLLTDMLAEFSPVTSSTMALEAADTYYDSDRVGSPERLADMLEESAFWTRHLVGYAARQLQIELGAGLVLGLVGLALLTLWTDELNEVFIAHVLCVVFAWWVLSDRLISALTLQSVMSPINELEIAARHATTLHEVLPVLGEYNALVELTPIVPDKLYLKHQAKLNALWEEHQRRDEPNA